MSTGKKIMLVLSFCLLPFILLIAGRLLKIYEIYRIPTSAMAPAVMPGDMIITSCLLTPQRNDLVSYKGTPVTWFKENPRDISVLLGRIVAIAGDKLQVKNGLLYINDKMVDDTMNLGYFFEMKRQDLNLKKHSYIDILPLNGDSLLVNASRNQLVSA